MQYDLKIKSNTGAEPASSARWGGSVPGCRVVSPSSCSSFAPFAASSSSSLFPSWLSPSSSPPPRLAPTHSLTPTSCCLAPPPLPPPPALAPPPCRLAPLLPSRVTCPPPAYRRAHSFVAWFICLVWPLCLLLAFPVFFPLV
jgi:hypothetical protein